MYGGKRPACRSGLFLHLHMDSGGRTQAIRLGGHRLYPLSYFSGPGVGFKPRNIRAKLLNLLKLDSYYVRAW